MKKEKFNQEEIRIIIIALVNERTKILNSPFVVKKSYLKKLAKITSKISNLGEKRIVCVG